MLLAGVDEVGGGDCIAGPLVTAVVVFNLDADIPEEIRCIGESKRVLRRKGPKEIERLYNEIVKVAHEWRCGYATAREITVHQKTFRRGGMHESTVKALGRAIRALMCEPSSAAVDGGIAVPTHGLGYYLPQQIESHADERHWVVAAASIVARYVRDSMMEIYHIAKIPNVEAYEWDKNFGRSTPAHIAAIEKFGVTAHHRFRFKEVRTAHSKYVMSQQ